MINIACLDPQWFADMLAGRKHTEFRERKRIDARLERIVPNERVVFLERGKSTRALLRTVEKVERIECDGKWLYAITCAPFFRVFSTSAPHRQGWHRRPTLR